MKKALPKGQLPIAALFPRGDAINGLKKPLFKKEPGFVFSLLMSFHCTRSRRPERASVRGD
jgi:hypothetical protein